QEQYRLGPSRCAMKGIVHLAFIAMVPQDNLPSGFPSLNGGRRCAQQKSCSSAGICVMPFISLLCSPGCTHIRGITKERERNYRGEGESPGCTRVIRHCWIPSRVSEELTTSRRRRSGSLMKIRRGHVQKST